jgi:hypothetical protein
MGDINPLYIAAGIVVGVAIPAAFVLAIWLMPAL